jgi:hypothetical protein
MRRRESAGVTEATGAQAGIGNTVVVEAAMLFILTLFFGQCRFL